MKRHSCSLKVLLASNSLSLSRLPMRGYAVRSKEAMGICVGGVRKRICRDGQKVLDFKEVPGEKSPADKVNILGRTIHRTMSTKTRTATVTSLEAGKGRATGAADKPKPTKRHRTESDRAYSSRKGSFRGGFTRKVFRQACEFLYANKSFGVDGPETTQSGRSHRSETTRSARLLLRVERENWPCRIVGQGEAGPEVLLHELVEHRLGRTAALGGGLPP